MYIHMVDGKNIAFDRHKYSKSLFVLITIDFKWTSSIKNQFGESIREQNMREKPIEKA